MTESLPDPAADDTEGHKVHRVIDDGDVTEADDTEGHKMHRAIDDGTEEDDTEGHVKHR